MNPFELHGSAYLGLYIGILMFGATTASVIKYLILNVDRNPWVPSDAIARELGPYEAAFLVGGSDRTFICACATLARHQIVSINRDGRTISLNGEMDTAKLQDLERTIVVRLKASGGSTTIAAVKQSAVGAISTIRKGLADKGLATDDETRSKALFLPWLWFVALTLGFALPKIAMATADKHPHGFLVMLMILACMASLSFFASTDKTNKGKLVAQALPANNSALKLTACTNPSALNLRDTALAYGVFGALAIYGDPFTDITYSLQPQRNTSGGCGSGHGCGGGGGCGGGCGGGGCGGCGG